MDFSIKRKKTFRVMVGSVPVGDGAPVSVQSMTNTKTENIPDTINQIHRLEKAGCEIIRVAVPNENAAEAIRQIKPLIHIPLIADIHFDYKLALSAAKNGADGLRINPGNIGSKKNVRAVVDCARDLGLPIRIGVNAGSIEKDIQDRYGGATPEGMVESAMRHVNILKELDFHQIKVSLKASDISRTIAAYRLMSEKTDIPLHVGVTEAGGLYSGIVKSAMGIGMLLSEGIGDTIRVSLTRDPVEEVRVGYEILKSLGIRQHGPEIISCPTCGRCDIDLFSVAERVEKALLTKSVPVKVAIMGCVVNGPGEAKEADVGIAGGRDKGILFKKGKIVKSISQDKLVDAVLDAVDEFEKEHK